MAEAELSFFLKQVDPLAVAKAYLNGTLKLPKEKFKFGVPTLTHDFVVGETIDSKIFEYIDKNGSRLRMISGNHDQYVNGQKDEFTCYWCRVKYSGKLALLLPVSIEKDENGLYFHGTGEYCSFACAYAHLKTKTHVNFYYKDYAYCDAEGLLKFMHYLYTGNEHLVAAPDWTLRDTLSEKDFYGSTNTYHLMPNVIMNPAKISFLRGEK